MQRHHQTGKTSLQKGVDLERGKARAPAFEMKGMIQELGGLVSLSGKGVVIASGQSEQFEN